MPAKVVIVSHRNPDGDAIGSCMALAGVLQSMNHVCTVVFPSEYPVNFSWMADLEHSLIWDVLPEEVIEKLQHAELIFCLDFNSLERVDKMGAYIESSPARKIMIDHHLDPEPFADYMYSRSDASSTCELVFDFVEEAGWLNYLSPNVIAALYTGILTDTGSFRHATNARIFEIMAELKRRGLDDYWINDQIHNVLPEKNLRLLGHALLNRMEVITEHSAGIIYLTKADYEDFDIQRGDTEGIVNYILTIKGIQLAAFITEQPNIVKLSLRSKHDVDVQSLARNHFNGGGHKNASGGYTYEPIDKAIRRLKKVIPDYIRIQNETAPKG